MTDQPEDLNDDQLNAVTGGSGSPGGFDLGQIANLIRSQTATSDASMNALLQTPAPGSMAALMASQQMAHQASLAAQVQRTMINGVSDALKGTIRKDG